MGWHSQQYGSFERFLVALARVCRNSGLETHLVFPREPSSQAFVRDVESAVHVVPSPVNIGDPRFARGVGKLLRSLRPTHLHAHFGLDALESLAVAAASGVPRRFATKHITPSPSRVSAVGHRLLVGLAEAVFAVSADVRDRLAALGVPPRKLSVIHLGVDTAVYHPDPPANEAVRAELGLPPGVRLILSTSHLRPGKGVEQLPRLAAALVDDPGDVCIVVAGDGPLRDQIEADAPRRRVTDDRFRLLGVREDVPRLLAAADVVVFPSTGMEGFPLAPLEALATARPVVASSGTAELSRSLNGVAELVAPGDGAALLAACRRLLSDTARASALGAAGRRLVAEDFSTKRAADEHLAEYSRRSANGAGSGDRDGGTPRARTVRDRGLVHRQ
jgi:glycosyltransferase involved in cell wall biosynthesis